jgi:hypothetical protein
LVKFERNEKPAWWRVIRQGSSIYPKFAAMRGARRINRTYSGLVSLPDGGTGTIYFSRHSAVETCRRGSCARRAELALAQAAHVLERRD